MAAYRIKQYSETSYLTQNNGAVGTDKKTSRNRKIRTLAADGRHRLQDNLIPLDLVQGI